MTAICCRQVSRLALMAVVFLAGCGTGLDVGSGSGSTLATQVFTLTNNERSSEGIAALTWNDQLAVAAAVHAKDMADRDYFSHYSPEGEDVGDRATQAGYQWAWVGENIAKGQRTAAQVVQAWMDSPGHRENIVREEFTELGVAVWEDALGTLYWVQAFGRPQ